MTNTKTHGGTRPGAGRKSSGDGRTERLSVRLTEKLAARLRDSGRAGELIESAFEFWDANQDRSRHLESGDVNQAGLAHQGDKPTPATLENGDANQAGLTLSFLAEFASLGRKVWADGADGICIENIPMGLSDARLRAKWGKWAEDADALADAYRRYQPMASRVREILLSTNPVLTDSDLSSWYEKTHNTVNVDRAIGLLHAYALIINDGALPCGGRALIEFMGTVGMRIEVEESGRWISEALEANRLDVAVAFGAGDYAIHGEEAVLNSLRATLKMGTALAWWERDAEFCRKIDPIIETLAGMPEFLILVQKADKVQFWALIQSIPPDWESLAAFKDAWAPMAAKHGEEVLFMLFERFTTWKRSELKHRLALRPPWEPDPGPDLAILGLKPGATPQDIKKAFRSFRQRHHPDKGGDHDHFLRGEKAYANLIKGTKSTGSRAA
jgi:hypothetical protein